jgi:putative sigma-54 modulation protein
LQEAAADGLLLEGNMKVTYSGKTNEFTPQLEKKVEAKLAKLGKMIEHKGEKIAHVWHRQEKRLHKVDIKTEFYDHALIGYGSDTDLGTAVTQAMEKLDKQIVKLRNKWRDTQRDPRGARAQKENGATEPKQAAAPAAGKPAKADVPKRAAQPRIFRVSFDESLKPMTAEEAMLVMDGKTPYFVYRDQDRSCLSVLFRRKDGHFDLIEP